MKSICWYLIWSYKNTNLLDVCVVLFFLHLLCSISSLNLSIYKKWRHSILFSSSNLSLCIYHVEIQDFKGQEILLQKQNKIRSSRKNGLVIDHGKMVW